MLYYVTDIHPHSTNLSGKEIYKRKIRKDYAKKYGLPPEKWIHKIYTKIIHIADKRRFDIDNVSKPLIDSFTGFIYVDDKIVVRREAIAIDKNDWYELEIDIGKLDNNTVWLLDQYLSDVDNKEITYCEFGEFDLKMVKVGEEY